MITKADLDRAREKCITAAKFPDNEGCGQADVNLAFDWLNGLIGKVKCNRVDCEQVDCPHSHEHEQWSTCAVQCGGNQKCEGTNV